MKQKLWQRNRFAAFFHHFFWGIYYAYPICCVFEFALHQMANGGPTAWLRGCTSLNGHVGYAHCKNCADRLHLGHLLFNMSTMPHRISWILDDNTLSIIE